MNEQLRQVAYSDLVSYLKQKIVFHNHPYSDTALFKKFIFLSWTASWRKPFLFHWSGSLELPIFISRKSRISNISVNPSVHEEIHFANSKIETGEKKVYPWKKNGNFLVRRKETFFGLNLLCLRKERAVFFLCFWHSFSQRKLKLVKYNQFHEEIPIFSKVTLFPRQQQFSFININLHCDVEINN